MAVRVLVTPRSFGRHSAAPREMLESRGIEIVPNPHGRILTKDEMMELVRDVDAVIVGVDPLDREVMERAPRLKMIAKYGVGTDNIDTACAAERGIRVATAAGANTEAVADYTFALMLASARRVLQIDRGCRQGDWTKLTTVDVYGRTLGLIGMGSIGKAVVRRAKGFDMNVIAYDEIRDEPFAGAHGVRFAESVDEVLAEADFVSLHVPLTERTRRMIGRRELGLMRPTAVLVNTARGGLIDEDALHEALREGAIWGAGVDVFETEPPVNLELLRLDNLIVGSHCAASTVQAIDNMGRMASRHIADFFDGRDPG